MNGIGQVGFCLDDANGKVHIDLEGKRSTDRETLERLRKGRRKEWDKQAETGGESDRKYMTGVQKRDTEGGPYIGGLKGRLQMCTD